MLRLYELLASQPASTTHSCSFIEGALTKHNFCWYCFYPLSHCALSSLLFPCRLNALSTTTQCSVQESSSSVKFKWKDEGSFALKSNAGEQEPSAWFVMTMWHLPRTFVQVKTAVIRFKRTWRIQIISLDRSAKLLTNNSCSKNKNTHTHSGQICACISVAMILLDSCGARRQP